MAEPSPFTSDAHDWMIPGGTVNTSGEEPDQRTALVTVPNKSSGKSQVEMITEPVLSRLILGEAPVLPQPVPLVGGVRGVGVVESVHRKMPLSFDPAPIDPDALTPVKKCRSPEREVRSSMPPAWVKRKG